MLSRVLTSWLDELTEARAKQDEQARVLDKQSTRRPDNTKPILLTYQE
jgi:hypothetical protein